MRPSNGGLLEGVSHAHGVGRVHQGGDFVGVAALREGDLLFGVAGIGFGVAGIGFGVAGIGFGVTIVRRIGVFVPVVTWLASLTKAPKR